jgi:hypothetical protein
MRRVWLAFFLAPLVVSLSFGVFALIAYPIMLVITVAFAVPLFFLLRRMRWLDWWHALLAGAACGAIYFVLDAMMRGWFRIDRIATANNVFYLGLGAGIGILYWWIGIFRNAAFPYISQRFPKTFLLVVPLAALLVVLHQSLNFRVDQGRATKILLEPTNELDQNGRLIVRLTSGATIEADYGSTWPREMIEGKCVHVTERWSMMRNRRVWEVAVPFGGGVDAC